MPDVAKRAPIKNYAEGDVVFIYEKINDIDERETYYRVISGAGVYPNSIKVARLATFQGEPAKTPRYMVILDKPCVDPGEMHGANPVYPVSEGVFSQYLTL